MKLGIAWLGILAVACASPPEATPPATDRAPEVVPEGGKHEVVPEGGRPPIAASARDQDALRGTARGLAGLTGAGLTGAEWSRHAELMDEIWIRIEERHLGPMRSWAEAELPLADPEAPLYYPFGGPDLPSALQFFPAASSYVLVGLEPPGRIPNLEGLAGEGLAGGPLRAELERLRGGLKNLAEAGYFVTKRMETDFVASRLEGVLPVLYIFLARAGLEPKSVEFIRLDDEGTAVPLEDATGRTATAVRIELSGDDHGDAGKGEPSRRLYYFSRDLSNSGLASSPAFVAFLRRLGAFNVYMKSASYLLHMDDFTAHKDFLTAHAGTVLQDDSGIPLRDLPSADWQLRFFGTYSRTLPTYRDWFQEDLEAVYQQAGSPALPFAVGYHSKIGGSCLIWAERRE